MRRRVARLIDGRPRSLVAVAGLFAASSVVGAISMISVAEARRSVVTLAVTLLGVLIARGLLRLRDGWRICALALVFLTIALLVFSVAALTWSGPVTITFVRGDGGVVSDGVLGAVFAAVGVVLGWMAWVLTRPRILRLFGNAVPADDLA